eukprot:TRINITY_DN2431_c0_g1_i2.p1 TRINITY_DN2431_c0_g1~~TRINITY_DN2431_c0_g1_i2.p1  ORF type:complete len:401 (-),score=137.82 TRINITY_DN2431_c0_g1_i2:1368-2417(-)
MAIVKEETKENNKSDDKESEVKKDTKVYLEEVKEETAIAKHENAVMKKMQANHEEPKASIIKKKQRKVNKEDSLAKSLAMKEYEEIKMRARKFFTATTSSMNKGKARKNRKGRKKTEQLQNAKRAARKHSGSPTSTTSRNSSVFKRNKTPNKDAKSLEEASDSRKLSGDFTTNSKSNRKSEYGKVEELINEIATGEAKAETAPNNELFLEPPIFYDPFYLNEDHKRIIDNLNKEIADIITALDSYNEALYPVCESIRKTIELHAHRVFPDLKDKLQAFLYGSAATGLALEDSDVDITLLSISASTSDEYMESVAAFGNELKRQDFILECKVIATARVPVIKLVFLRSLQ